MTITERFVKERNDALFSLDREKIEAYMLKYGEPAITDMSDEVSGLPFIKQSAVSTELPRRSR